MKPTSALLVAASAALLFGCHSKPALKTTDQKFSYGLGVNIGSGIKQQGVNIDRAAFEAGFTDGQSGAKLQINEEDLKAALMAKQQEVMAKRQADSEAAGKKAQAEGEKFLADNKGQAGVQTTPSGLQFKVEKEGTGKKATSTSQVTINYKGTLVDGTEFDASKPDAPATLPLDHVIPGFSEGLQLMSEGGVYDLYIPSNLAYGPQGGGQIPANSVLIFHVELVKVSPGAAPAAASKAPAPVKK